MSTSESGATLKKLSNGYMRAPDTSPVEEESAGKVYIHLTPEHKGIWNGNNVAVRDCKRLLRLTKSVGTEDGSIPSQSLYF